MTLEELTNRMKNASVADLTLVGKAFTFAENAHRGHLRYSGEPYVTHLTETANILAELGMGGTAVAAGLLHDTIEDVGVSAETLEKEFGSEVRMLVEGVTKLGRLRYRGVDRYSESLRRLFIASSKDLRVLIIKLADRVHNMRTLVHVPEEKRARIAMETLEIYAPIAYRLGIRKINRELEELSFPFAYPAEYVKVKALATEKSADLERRLEKFHKSLLKGLARHGILTFATHHRIKGLYSLFVKLKNKEWDLSLIFDVLAIRIIVGSVEDCYRVLGVIHALWRPLPGRIKDYIAFPKPNGYRSLHTLVFTGDGGIVEIQIRTEEMHRESEYGVTAHFEYKERARRTNGASYLEWAKRMLSALVTWGAKSSSEEKPAAVLDTLLESDVPTWVKHLGELDSAIEERQFWNHLRDDFFKHRSFIFTPKGDVVDLPTESSPVDFAYAIHSDIGDHMVGAKVNDKLVSIDTTLKNGDIVQILTREGARPSQKWLHISKTAMAKKHIRNALQKLEHRYQ